MSGGAAPARAGGMSHAVRDRITGAILFAVALAWVGLVHATIPPGQGTLVGPRAFPFWFGVALAVLSLVLVLQSFRRPSLAPPPDAGTPLPRQAFSVGTTVGAILLYGTLLEPLGFLPATALTVALMMVVILRIRRPVPVAAMSIGLALGCYIVFGKLLGTYLPPGRLIGVVF